MKTPTFLEGAGVALLAALAAGLGQAALAWSLPPATAARLTTLLVGFGYLAYLLRRSPERAGRVVAVGTWFAAAGLLWLAWPPLPFYVLAHLGLLWLARSLYLHHGPLAALMDLGLTGLALIAGLGAWLHTGSVFLAVWCLFLVQALFVLIPSRPGPRKAFEEEDRFERAHRSAEAAVRKLSSPSFHRS